LLAFAAVAALLCNEPGGVPGAVAQSSQVVDEDGGRVKMHCPGAAANAHGQVQLPANRTYHLMAEAKTGTTWFQQLAFQLVDETCRLYDRSVAGVTCTCTCLADKNGMCGGADECPYTEARYCRTISATFTERKGGATPVVRHILVETSAKHTIPFITLADHPNKTPVLLGTPPWLEECILAGNFECRPPSHQLVASLGYTSEQAQDILAPLYPDLSAFKLHRLIPGARPDVTEPQAVLTIFRDPRSVAVSAAHYAPGVNLFGHQGFERTGTIDTFVDAVMNMTTAWTQFRRYWFDKLDEEGIIPLCVRPCVRACMRSCVHACMLACVHACARAGMCGVLAA
jgi:hypothetical protein